MSCPVDWSAARAHFPIFEQRVYLASQCLGPYPRQAHRDAEQYRASRQLHNRALEEWFGRLELTIGLIERLLGAPPGSVALRDSATACHAALLSALQPAGARNRLVVGELDFHSTLHVCTAQTRRGFEVDVVRSRDGASLAVEDVVARIDERTASVAIAHVSRYGALLDPRPIVARAHEVGAVVILDAYQAVGIVPIDVVELGVDALVGGNHKWLSGDTGLAFLYVEPALADRLEPAYPGWFGHQDTGAFVNAHAFVDAYQPVSGARRFQQGTPPMQPIYTARAGLERALELEVARMRARNLELTVRLARGAEELGLRVRTPIEPDRHAGGVCIEVPEPERVVARLAERGIDVDQRRREVVRAAPHPCNTEDEVDHFVASLADVVRRGRAASSPSTVTWPAFRGELLVGDALARAGYLGDFGGLVSRRPQAVLRAADVEDVVLAAQHARSTGQRIVARGRGHTTRGQCQASDALVVDLGRLDAVAAPERGTVRVGAGARWSSVVTRTFAAGLTPPVLTDYLDLTVGGTLSVGGVGGQSFAHGLQVDNVVELEVVTGEGARVRCSPDHEAELFHACLGGLGRFGIIAEATLRLVPAPREVIVRSLPFDALAPFLDAQHALAEQGAFDCLVGNFTPPAAPGRGVEGWELAIECVRDASDERELDLASTGARLDREPAPRRLGWLAYVHRLESMVRAWQASGAWTARHPWIDLFIPRVGACELIADALDGLDRRGLGDGYVMTYPLVGARHGRALPVLPVGERLFLFDILPTVATADAVGLAALERRNEQLLKAALANGATVYPIGYPLGSEHLDDAMWRRLLGDRKDALRAVRTRHDPSGCCGSSIEGFP